MKDVLVGALAIGAIAYLYMLYNKEDKSTIATMPNKIDNPKDVSFVSMCNCQKSNCSECKQCGIVNDYTMPSFDAKGNMMFK